MAMESISEAIAGTAPRGGGVSQDHALQENDWLSKTHHDIHLWSDYDAALKKICQAMSIAISLK